MRGTLFLHEKGGGRGAREAEVRSEGEAEWAPRAERKRKRLP